MDTYLKDFFDFIKKQSDQGGAEIRLVATIYPDNVIVAYAHPFGKNGDTFDFMLVETGGQVVMSSNPNTTKAVL